MLTEVIFQLLWSSIPWTSPCLLDITKKEEACIVCYNLRMEDHELDNFRTIYIDTGDINTVQFKLSDIEKQKLILAQV